MCDCFDGVVGDDEYGPIFCERCTVGLDLALSDCATREQGWIEAMAGYAPAEQSRFWAEMHKQAQDIIDRLISEFHRLQAVYDAVQQQPDPALAWQPRPEPVRQATAAMAVMQETR